MPSTTLIEFNILFMGYLSAYLSSYKVNVIMLNHILSFVTWLSLQFEDPKCKT